MGLDIGVAHEIRWMPRPGWDFGDKLMAKIEEDDHRLTLDNIKESFEEFKSECADSDDVENAQEVVTWAEEYWQERGLAPTAGLTTSISC